MPTAAARFALRREPGRIRVDVIGILNTVLVKAVVEMVVSVRVELGEVGELVVRLGFLLQRLVNRVWAARWHPRADLLTGQSYGPRTGRPLVVVEARRRQ